MQLLDWCGIRFTSRRSRFLPSVFRHRTQCSRTHRALSVDLIHAWHEQSLFHQGIIICSSSVRDWVPWMAALVCWCMWFSPVLFVNSIFCCGTHNLLTKENCIKNYVCYLTFAVLVLYFLIFSMFYVAHHDANHILKLPVDHCELEQNNLGNSECCSDLTTTNKNCF